MVGDWIFVLLDFWELSIQEFADCQEVRKNEVRDWIVVCTCFYCYFGLDALDYFIISHPKQWCTASLSPHEGPSGNHMGRQCKNTCVIPLFFFKDAQCNMREWMMFLCISGCSLHFPFLERGHMPHWRDGQHTLLWHHWLLALRIDSIFALSPLTRGLVPSSSAGRSVKSQVISSPTVDPRIGCDKWIQVLGGPF